MIDSGRERTMKRFISLLAFVSVVAVSVIATTPATATDPPPLVVVSNGGETWKDVPTDMTGTAAQVTDFDWGLTIPGAFWIWKTAQGSLADDAAVVIFKERFTAEKAGWGKIQITADNKYRLRLNGKEIAREGDWPTIDVYDVYVVKGENLLKVRVKNFPTGTVPPNNPAGLIYRLEVTYA
jgi:hypothetical protein